MSSRSAHRISRLADTSSRFANQKPRATPSSGVVRNQYSAQVTAMNASTEYWLNRLYIGRGYSWKETGHIPCQVNARSSPLSVLEVVSTYSDPWS